MNQGIRGFTSTMFHKPVGVAAAGLHCPRENASHPLRAHRPPDVQEVTLPGNRDLVLVSAKERKVESKVQRTLHNALQIIVKLWRTGGSHQHTIGTEALQGVPPRWLPHCNIKMHSPGWSLKTLMSCVRTREILLELHRSHTGKSCC